MKNLCLLLCLWLPQIGMGQPNIKWSFNTHDASFGQSAAADLDNDGKLEVVFGCYRNDSCVYALNAEDGSLLWKFNAAGAAEGCNDAAPLIYDVDNDGIKDVLVASSCNPKTFCLNGNDGTVKWTCNTRGSDSPPSITDLENDGKLDLLHGEFGGYVICINAQNGARQWELAVDTDSWIQTAPTICDIDGDGKPDFVVATWNAKNRNANKVYAYRGYDRKLLWTHSLNDVVYHGTAYSDLGNDGNYELFLGSYNDTLYCLDARTGSTKWTFSYGPNFAVTSPAVIADLDHDGKCDVVFSAWYKMTALRADGSLMWSYNLPGYAQCFRGVAVSKLNNDAFPDLVFGTDAGDLIALQGQNGNLLFRKNLRSDYGDSLFSLEHAPLVADFDKDGTVDVFVVGGHAEYPDFYKDFGRAYMLSVGPDHGMNWPMFQRDILRRSNACNYENTSTPAERYPSSASLHILKGAQDGNYMASVSCSLTAPSRLSLYNAQGRLEFSIPSLILHPGTNIIPLPTAKLSPGIYLCRVESMGQVLTQKFCIP
ncbi:MAG: VCBS repeat-containing protein [Bacteroidetes bacterium]|nr:VCBS repeat-containing protein [Bacteroidota bacterium]